jgi:hypothetical protein
MRAHAFVLHAVVLAMLSGPADCVAASDAAGPAAFVLSPDSRVRCLDHEARHLVEAAVAASPTVARMMADLQHTDLIVGIETEPFQRKTKGDARLLGATAATRHVRIRIRIPGPQGDLMSVLGHELQHALELAAAPEVRDEATLRAHYLRIGFARMEGGYYETEAARETGRRVAAEVGAARVTGLQARRE